MSQPQALRRAAIGACALIGMALAACTGAPARDASQLDARFAGPCDRVNINWQGRSTALHLVRCPGPGWRSKALLFAYAAEPVDPADVPLVVTGIPDDGWRRISQLWADAPTHTLLTSMGYEVLPAEIGFDVEVRGAAMSVSAEIETPSGRVRVTAADSHDIHTVSERRALITDTNSAVTAFFGPESASRATLREVDVEVDGVSALTGIGAAPSETLDQELTSDRIFWRLPK